MARWYVWVEGSDAVGPVDAELVARGVEAGRIPAAAQVREEHANSWTPLTSVPRFAQFLKDAHESLPTMKTVAAAKQRAPESKRGETYATSRDLASLVGQDLAGFHLTAMLGEGGMAVVFRGQNLLDQTITRAIKIVRPELSANPEFVRRFTEEARVLENLQHKNIVRFYGLRRERGLLIMELELMVGESLSAHLKQARGRLRVADAVEWMQQAAEGVGAAHRQTVVHRDIKPENLFLTQAGVMKVLDFGIARALDDADRAAKLTVAGMTLGTPAYMAPEVCNGGVPTEAADVYALGMTLYEALAGAHPLIPDESARKSSAQLMFAQINSVIPPVSQVRGDVPSALSDVVSIAIAKEPTTRFKDGVQFAEALRGVRALLGTVAATEAPGTRFALPQIGAPRASSPQLEGTSGTQFAMPQIDRVRTTGATAIAQADAVPRRRGAGLIVGSLLLMGSIAAVGLLVANKKGEGANAAASASASVAPSASAAEPELNKWIDVMPPDGAPVVLGLPDTAGTLVRGFRHARNIEAPSTPFEIQQHEVTWGELDPWLAKNPDAKFPVPADVPPLPGDRKMLPATNVSWETAHAYCHAIGGALPHEEEWEYAARGPHLRGYAWGSEALDLERTNSFAGKDAKVKAVMSNDQDQTPGDDANALYDMMGNAQEWTADLFRVDMKPQSPTDEAWVQEGGTSWRGVRGFPLNDAPPRALSMVNAAYRSPLCASGPCPKGTDDRRHFVGFRCVKHSKKGPP